MSFCRPLLLPVHISKFHCQRLATRTANAAYNTTLRPNVVGQPARLLGGPHGRDTTLNTTSLHVALSSLHIPKRTMSTTNASRGSFEAYLTPLHYEEERLRDPKSVANLPPSSYLDTYYSAVASEKLLLAEAVVSDVLDIFEGTDATRNHILEDILSNDMWLLKRETVLRMLETLRDSSSDALGPLLMRNDGNIARKMLDSVDIQDTDRPFLRLLYPFLLERLKTIRNPRKLKTTTFKPPFLIYATFAALQKLLVMSFHEQAIGLFQALVQTGYTPTEALHNIDNSSGNPALIVSMAVIRSCIYWNWRALAAAFMTELIMKHPPTKSIIDLNIDAIYALLNTHPTARDIRACGHLIRRIHTHSPVPDSIIRLFYNRAMTAEAKEEAEDLYMFTRSQKVRDTHHYPPPHDVALPWLLDHLAMTSSQTHLARTLSTEAAQDGLHIPAPYRAQFIARVASLGYAVPARALWERYATGKDGVVVAGSSALMIRMVSLHWNVHKSSLGKANAIRGKEGSEIEFKRLKDNSNDAAAFAEHVRLAFGFHHAPLAQAHHWHLTSLARACFIVGKISEGYQALRYLIDRRESPDLYDVNVALSAVAQLNPHLASQMIQRMTDIGLRPDGVSFGTALHYAVIQGDREVVDEMIERIRNLDDARISVKTLTNLVHASLALEKHGSQEEIHRTLTNILYLINSFPNINMSSQTQLAKALVYAALRAKDGVIAFNLWNSLLRKGAQWDDIEQQRLRHSIAFLIKQPSFPLPEDKDDMLAQLGIKRMS